MKCSTPTVGKPRQWQRSLSGAEGIVNKAHPCSLTDQDLKWIVDTQINQDVTVHVGRSSWKQGGGLILKRF